MKLRIGGGFYIGEKDDLPGAAAVAVPTLSGSIEVEVDGMTVLTEIMPASRNREMTITLESRDIR